MENSRIPSEENRAWHPMEYAHVLLWLVKDMCWAQGWKLAGTIMVLPTIVVAIILTWLQRTQPVTRAHNVAITLWITSNSLWMLAEFYKLEEILKPISTAGFALGLLVLGIQYMKLMMVRKQKSP
jgi:uncharacterized membrane protein YciS (DUF1049 family)